jgi:hypothetical protein
VIPIQTYRIIYQYTHQGIIDKLKNDFSMIELNSDYMENVSLKIGIPKTEAERFEGKLSSHLHLFDDFKKCGEFYHIKKIRS